MKKNYELQKNRRKGWEDFWNWRKLVASHTHLLLLVLLLISISANVAYAQQTVSGKIYDASTQESLPGVNILIQGTSTGTVSDIDGSYSIRVPNEDAVLVFSFVGYLTQEIRVGNQSNIDVNLSADPGPIG
ncbi:MAG: carboxypeptidase-like regulatory domain-containing protein [Cyclobacteriaceae bacterium]